MRKLASIRRVSEIKKIPNADKICTYCIDGWTIVDSIDKYKVGDLVVMLEIDSWVPNSIAPFLTPKDKTPKEYNGTLGEKIRSIKLRGQISQGLLLPISILGDTDLYEGMDVTEILGVQKYEPPLPAQIAGDARSFSWPISKTDEIRVQTSEGLVLLENLKGKPYYISLKLDGTSSTFLIDPVTEEYHVCGRNYSYKNNSSHSFWIISERYNIEDKLRSLWDKGLKIAIQGECCGPGVQKNPLGLNNVDLYIFNVIDIANNKKLPLDLSLDIADQMGLNFVKILEKGHNFEYNKDELLFKAQGKYKEYFPSANPSQEREGIVIRSLCGEISFKAINNNFLLKE